jgi:hypothetical protein
MCIYCQTNKYRKIYENHRGPILRDEFGRTYEIHHLDGNHLNNTPDNLLALSIQEHYNIHYSQGDWSACVLMARKMKLPLGEASRLMSLAQRARVADGTHPFLGGEIQRQNAKRQVAAGTHNLLGDKTQRQQVENGTHHFLGGEIQRKQVENGTHHFLGGKIQRKNNQKRVANGTHPFIKSWKCEHCGTEGTGTGNYRRWHGNKCNANN